MHPDQREFIRTDTARILLEAGAVQLRTNPPFIYASGRQGLIYCDNRVLLSEVGFRDHVAGYFLKHAADLPYHPDVIAGVATSGISWAAILADRLELPHAYVRAEPKGHGKGNTIEGRIRQGQRVLLVEDLVNTGGSSVRVIENIRAAGGVVDDCLAIVTYELDDAVNAFDAASCRVHPLTGFSTLVDVAVERRYISPEQESLVRAWQKNPATWAETHHGERR